MSLAGLSTQQLLELGGLKQQCSAKLRCVAHGLFLPCELCEGEDGAGPGVVCDSCGHHFAQGLLTVADRPCQSVAEFIRTGKIPFEDEARAAWQRLDEAERQAAERLRIERERQAAEEAAREAARDAEASRRRAEEAERARLERERLEREALEQARAAEAARGAKRAAWSRRAALASCVLGSAWVWSMPFVHPPKTTGYLIGYAILVLLLLGMSVSPLLGTEAAHRSLRRSSPLTWAVVAFAWPAVAALLLCLLVAKAEFTLRYVVALFVGGLVFPGLVVVTCSHVGTALSMSAPWPQSLGAGFRGMRSPWIWAGLLLTLGLNTGLTTGKANGFEGWFVAVDKGGAGGTTPAALAGASAVAAPVTRATVTPTTDAKPVPAPTGLVADVAAALPPEDVDYLQARLALLAQAGATARLLVVPGTGGEPIEAFGRRVGNAWNAAGPVSHTDILITVATDERRIRIDVTKAFEEALTDSEARRLIDAHFGPAARKSGVPDGLRALVDQLERTLATPRHALADADGLQAATWQALQAMAAGVGRWDGKRPTLPTSEEAKVDSAIAQLESMPRPARGDRKTARQLHANGLSLLGQAGFEALAAEKMLLAHQADPLDVQVLNDLAFAEMSSGRHALAVNHLLATLRLSPTRTSAWVNLAETVPFTVSSRAEAVRRASDLYLTAYWFSKDRAKTVEYLRTRSAAPDTRDEVRAAATDALQRLDTLLASETPTQAAAAAGARPPAVDGAIIDEFRFAPSAERKDAPDAATARAAEAATRVFDLVLDGVKSGGVNIPSAGQLLSDPRVVAAIQARDQAIAKAPANRPASSAALQKAQELSSRPGAAQQVVEQLGEAFYNDPFNASTLDAVKAALWRTGRRQEAVQVAAWHYMVDPLRPAALMWWVEAASSSGAIPPDKAGAMMAVAFALSGEDPLILAQLKEIRDVGARQGKASEAAREAVGIIESEQWQQRSRATARN